MEDYEKDIAIDPDALDVENVDHPMLVFKYNRLLSEAKDEVDAAREHLDISRAEVAMEIRESPEEFGLEKVTEGGIKAAVEMDERVDEARSRVHEARHAVGVLDAVCKSLEHRKRCLDNLVKLHGNEYFSGPIGPRNISQEYERKRTLEHKREEAKGKVRLGKRKPKRKSR